jgi:hypothetical protein
MIWIIPHIDVVQNARRHTPDEEATETIRSLHAQGKGRVSTTSSLWGRDENWLFLHTSRVRVTHLGFTALLRAQTCARSNNIVFGCGERRT